MECYVSSMDSTGLPVGHSSESEGFSGTGSRVHGCLVWLAQAPR